MKRMAWAVAACAVVAGCLAGRTRTEYDELLQRTAPAAVARPEPAAGPPGASEPASLDADEASLERATTLPVLTRIALSRNPDLAEARERARAAALGVPAAARWPDLELKYEQWGVPLRSPLSLDQAQMLMWGLRQAIPAPGSLDARARIALGDAQGTLEAQRARRLDVAAQVRRAFAQYYRAYTELAVHQEHVRLTAAVVDLARANFRVGRTTQQDVLRTVVELSRIHSELAMVEQDLRSAGALLNALLGRPLEAPLGPPPQPSSPDLLPPIGELERTLLERRPELQAAGRAIERSEASLDRARSEARWPALMVGADYWYLPTATDVRNAWSAMVSVSLPWLNPGHRDEVRAAEHAHLAETQALMAARTTALYQLRDALARHEAARQSFQVIDHDLTPQAQQSFEAAQSAFAAGQADGLSVLDALRSYLQVRLDRARALARLEATLADVDRAVGAEPQGGGR
jgi:outer membrane protein TolC